MEEKYINVRMIEVVFGGLSNTNRELGEPLKYFVKYTPLFICLCRGYGRTEDRSFLPLSSLILPAIW